MMIRRAFLLLGLVLANHHRVKGFSSSSYYLNTCCSITKQHTSSSIAGLRLPSSTVARLSFKDQQQELPGLLPASFFVPDDDNSKRRVLATEYYDIGLIVLFVVPPILGYFFWGEISSFVAYFFDQFSGFPGSNVDGNAFATNLLRPTINGVVVAAAAIALGTLFATTVNVLWNRQLKMRTCINKEVAELRLLRRAIFGCFGTAQHSRRRATALSLLHCYTRTIRLETLSQSDSLARLEDIQMNGGISMNEMDELADMLHGVDGAAVSRQGSLSKAQDLLVSLNGHRSERVAVTLTCFPAIHWSYLGFLYLIINISFFMDSNQGVLQYLNALQLRILFSILVGVGSGAAMLLVELEDPFQGFLGITLATMQLERLEKLLLADMVEAEKESERVGPPALVSLDRDCRRPKYNKRNTIYFHLYTGPWGAGARILGDFLAWSFRQLFVAIKKFRIRNSRKDKQIKDVYVKSDSNLFHIPEETSELKQ